MADSLLLCHKSAGTDQIVNRLRSERGSVSWLFLCQDYLRLREFQRAIGSDATQAEIGDALNQTAEELRGPFLDLITELGRRDNSISWWASRVSERNTMVSPLFLFCCYLKVGKDLLENRNGAVAVISESWEVLESLADVARDLATPVTWLTRPAPGSLALKSYLKKGLRLVRFVASSVSQRANDSGTPSVESSKPRILLRTWVDEACFGDDGVFNDRYFPGLCEWLEAEGYSVTTVPVLFSLNRSYRSAWDWLRRSQRQFLNPYNYYGASDYFFALCQARRRINLPAGELDLNGLNVGRLFRAEERRAAFDNSCVESILSYRLPHRLARRRFSPDILIDAFENMIPDKLFILGFRRYLPNTRLVGSQHGSLYPLLLCLFVTRGEAEFAPVPDRVVCNGELFREILIREGLPEERAVLGSALRYAHLWSAEPTDKASDQKIVLVPLPLVLDSAVELLTKVVSALAATREIEVWLKVHPMSSRETLLSATEVKPLPEHFKFVRGAMGELLPRSKVVVALSSNTVHEALAAGVPVLVVGREAALDLNPLSWYPDLSQVIRNPEKLRERVLELLNSSAQDLANYRHRSAEVLNQCFRPVTEEGMQAFVTGLLPNVEAIDAVRQAKRAAPAKSL